MTKTNALRLQGVFLFAIDFDLLSGEILIVRLVGREIDEGIKI